MLKILRGWVDRYLSDEEAILLLAILVASFTVIILLGSVLAPVITALIFAYLLQGTVIRFKKWGLSHLWSSVLTFLIFVLACLAILLIVLPAISSQISDLFVEAPKMISKGQALLAELPNRYPDYVDANQVREWTGKITTEIGQLGQYVLSASPKVFSNVMAVVIYLVLVPVLVFFFLKDSQLLTRWCVSLLPNDHKLMANVWEEMDQQIANYIRGKAVEILIVGVVSYIAFAILGLNYAVLLAVLVGLSVLIPYIGAAAVTIPVLLIGYFQWGFNSEFITLAVVYGIIQALDGNALVPLLFSEVVNLHPVAIILAVLVFGGVWGFWGVFFAIPLATLFKAIMTAWPKGIEAAHRDQSSAEPTPEQALKD
jgi:putative permease